MKRCPKCNFYMKDNYCVKCGYYEGKSISNLDKYQESNNDLEISLTLLTFFSHKYIITIYCV